jgi:hypothetical protein
MKPVLKSMARNEDYPDGLYGSSCAGLRGDLPTTAESGSAVVSAAEYFFRVTRSASSDDAIKKGLKLFSSSFPVDWMTVYLGGQYPAFKPDVPHADTSKGNVRSQMRVGRCRFIAQSSTSKCVEGPLSPTHKSARKGPPLAAYRAQGPPTERQIALRRIAPPRADRSRHRGTRLGAAGPPPLPSEGPIALGKTPGSRLGETQPM